MEMSHRCRIIDTNERERMSDSVNKASKVIESFSVTMTLNLTSPNDDVTGTRHTYCVLITFN